MLLRKRGARDRALLSSATVGSDISTFALAWCACIWGVAGVEIAAVFAVVSAVSQHLISWSLANSAGSGWPLAVKHADGGVYDGEWSGHEKVGLGVYKYPSGATYEGWWAANVKHGRGVYRYADGGKFEGEFVNGQRSGLGVRTWPSGAAKVIALSRSSSSCAISLHCFEFATAVLHATIFV